MILRRLCSVMLILLISTVAHAGTQRALLIGVSNYEANLPPLAGSKNDVTLIRELLTYKFGFDRSNIQILIDEQATRAQILSSIRALSETSAPDDIVLIHYSGHGSQAPDTNGDEDDGFDETILPYDSRTEGIADITDDELNALIAGFQSRSVVVILDSCHSGTGTRSGPSLVSQRWVAPDTRKELYESIATRQVLTLPISENHVFFAAAQDFESELDGPFGPDNMRLGLFTAALVGVLANAPPTVTPREAIAGVSVRIEALKASAAGMPIPESNMEAPLEKQDQPMFVFRNAAPPVASPPGPPSTQVQFTSGDEPTFGFSRSLFATMNGTPQAGLANAIASSIGADMGVAQSLDEADAVVDVVAQGVFDIYGPGGAVKVASALHDGNSSPGDFGFLRTIILNAPTLADLVSLSSPQAGLQMQLRAAGVPGVRARSISTRTVKVSVNSGSHKLQFYEAGDPRTRQNSLQLEAVSNHDCYLTIASLNSAGDVYLLLPNAGQELSGFLSKGLIPANTSVLLPDSLADENRAGFHFDYAPPGGVDRIIGICLRDLADAGQLRAQLNKLELGGVLDADLFGVEARGLLNIAPGNTSPVQAAASAVAPLQASPAPPPQATGNTNWAASILTLEVGAE